MTSPSCAASTPVGAYGLVVEGLRTPGEAIGLQQVPPGATWPRVELRCQPMSGARPPAHHLDDDRAVILLIGGGYATVERSTGVATILTSETIDERDLVHPYLGLPAGVIALWHGRTAFHAGGFVVDGVAWGVLGDREAGKTTTLAFLHRQGRPVLADDMVVVDGTTAFAGPRTLDLRPPTADRLAGSSDLVLVRGGDRARLLLPPLPPVLPFGGWVVLEEHDRLEVDTVPANERFDYLKRQHMMGVNHPVAVLEMLTLPMLRLRRPKAWSALPAAVEELTAAIPEH